MRGKLPIDYCASDYDVPQTRPIRIKQKLHAKALYNNVPDTPGELAFKRGDILTVLEQDTEGMQGWWLCTLGERKGLCPGNRLRILDSYDSGCFSLSPNNSPCPSLAGSTATLNSSICSTDIYENSSISSGSGGSGTSSIGYPSHTQHHHQQQQQSQHLQPRHGSRRSWHVSTNKVNIPQRIGDAYYYKCSTPSPTTPTFLHSHTQPHSLPLPAAPTEQVYSNQSIYQNLPGMATYNGATNSRDFETYDVPKPATPINYDCPKNVCRTPTSTLTSLKGCATPIQEESYDVPRPLHSLLQQQNTLTPSSSNSSLQNSETLSLSFSSSNRSSLANMPDYDIPRRNPIPVRAGVHPLAQQQQQQQQKQPQSLPYMGNGSICYDFPTPSTQSTPVSEKSLPSLTTSSRLSINGSSSSAVTKELPLELNSALEALDKLQSETNNAITRLLSYVLPNWRKHNKLENVLMDVHLAVVRLRTALHDLTEFSEGALGNATRSEDRNLAQKLRPLVRALRDADKLVHESTDSLDSNGWTLDHLARSDDKANARPPDSLDQLIACAQRLTEDVRQSASFIQGNALLLFKRSFADCGAIGGAVNGASSSNNNVAKDTVDGCRVTGNANGNGNGESAEWLEDYDYVSFESKDAVAKKHSALREAIPASFKDEFDTAIKTAETNALAAVAEGAEACATTPTNTEQTPPSRSNELTEKDKVLLHYYSVQICTHMGNLQQAIDSFLETVTKSQPPRYFIAYGKFVVVSAHNLVTIGDLLHRNISQKALRDQILECTDALSDALKTCVTKSKLAATQFPKIPPVQEMVNSVTNINHLANELRIAILYAAHQAILEPEE